MRRATGDSQQRSRLHPGADRNWATGGQVLGRFIGKGPRCQGGRSLAASARALRGHQLERVDEVQPEGLCHRSVGALAVHGVEPSPEHWICGHGGRNALLD